MADFIELTRYDGEKILVGMDHIVEIHPDTEGAIIYYDFATGNNGNVSQDRVHVKESFSTIKRKLGL